ncbi:hypothetical protein [Streptomyces sp. B93]|uniref:hypothetical protein n=1 Tax=Streptomyces sp. B93 TaxID=2824875 RepID=UPI001FFC5FDA|nr:hypothetical protein [Streptomyces sp. B93]
MALTQEKSPTMLSHGELLYPAGTLVAEPAALLVPGDGIGYDGEWRTVKAAKTERGPLGGLAMVVAWEGGWYSTVPCWG